MTDHAYQPPLLVGLPVGYDPAALTCRACGEAHDDRRLDFLILTMPDRELVNLSLREGIDFLDEPWPEFGPFYILETA